MRNLIILILLILLSIDSIAQESKFVEHINSYQNALKNGDLNKAVDEIKKCIDEYAEKVNNTDTTYALLIGRLAYIFTELEQYENALSLYEQVFEIFKKSFGEERPEVATSLNNLASIYAKIGQYEKALHLQEHSLKIYKKAFGEENLAVAISLDNLASFYADMSQYTKAFPYCILANK